MSHPKGGTYKDQQYQLPSHNCKSSKNETHTSKYREVASVRTWLAYPSQCCSINKHSYHKKRKGLHHPFEMGCQSFDTFFFLRVKVLILDLEEGEQKQNQKAKCGMECGAEIKFLLTATNRKTWNCLRLHTILVQNKN